MGPTAFGEAHPRLPHTWANVPISPNLFIFAGEVPFFGVLSQYGTESFTKIRRKKLNIKTHSIQRTAAAIRRGGPLMNLTEVAETIGRSKNTVRALAAAGVLPPTVRGKGFAYWSANDVRKLVDGVLPTKEGAQ